MKKVLLTSDNKWIQEFEERLKSVSDIDQADPPSTQVKHYAKEWYNYGFEIDPLGIFIMLEMEDAEATWFALKWDGKVCTDEIKESSGE